ncbi:uncharacterized protein LOC129613316 [Condylostylus longicornis]|uniref:uncharacterized protein LOC129613316 n=1 Tax=Condylostylus longicornis TaxID=2530218 RepID=UPI00244DA895|nr:uncharacterized protein LOC129613316 [Condylostylus longicornis]
MSSRRKPESKTYGSCPDRTTEITQLDEDDGSDSTEVLSSTDEEDRWKEASRSTDIPADYWNIQKLIKYIKAGNQTATIVALCCLKDYDLTTQINQLAISDIGGLEVLTNLLECNDAKCRLGALTILAEITLNIDIRRTVVDLGAVPLMINVLNTPGELKTMAAECLANVAKVRLARKYVRKCGGIPKLVDLLDCKLSILQTPKDELNLEDKKYLDAARAGARALWSLSDSRHNRELMRKSGIVPLMARLLKSVNIEVVIPIMGTIQKCASQANFQLAITTENMIVDIVNHLNNSDTDLKLQCSTAIFKCADDKGARDLVRQANGLDPLVAIARDKSVRENKPLLAAATGAIWKCAISAENVKKLDGLRTVAVLVQLLSDENYEVLTHVAGGIAECVRFPNNRDSLRNAGGLPLMVNLLQLSHAPLLENLCKALKECAEDNESMKILEQLDGVRFIWSLLKDPHPRVQAYAAYALCPCVQNAQNSGELVRSLVGAMELVVSLLSSKDNLVLSAICAAIATIARDETNLAILTDLKVVYKLATLVHTTDDLLRENLAAAIASCATYSNNTQEFGRLKTVSPIVGYMGSNNPAVHRTTAMALEKLSMDPQNCITMHQAGCVPFLLETVGSTDRVLQLASAGTLRNIRELALRAEELNYKYQLDTLKPIDYKPTCNESSILEKFLSKINRNDSIYLRTKNVKSLEEAYNELLQTGITVSRNNSSVNARSTRSNSNFQNSNYSRGNNYNNNNNFHNNSNSFQNNNRDRYNNYDCHGYRSQFSNNNNNDRGNRSQNNRNFFSNNNQINRNFFSNNSRNSQNFFPNDTNTNRNTNFDNNRARNSNRNYEPMEVDYNTTNHNNNSSRRNNNTENSHTGAATSIINPNIFPVERQSQLKTPIYLATLMGHRIIRREIITKTPSEFNENTTMSWKVFNLKNKNFDAILGQNVLTPIGARIDLLENAIEVNEGDTLTHINEVKHQIITKHSRPIYSKTYRFPKIHEIEVERQVKEMITQGIVQPSNSAYNSPIWVVPKKMDNSGKPKWRIVVDYRKLNEITMDDKFPIPNMDSLFDKLGRAQYFTTLDLAKGFHQILVDEKDRCHTLTPDGIKPNDNKVRVIKELKLPTTRKQIKSFLGITGYYRKFIKDYAAVAKPMTNYLKKDKKIDIHNQNYVLSFEKLKELITNYPTLRYPDFKKQFILTTDASNFAIGAVLSQDGHPICFASRTLNEHETRYSAIERELLAIVWATKYFRPYLYGTKFIIRTDHQPLAWLHSLKEPNSKLQRWKIRLNEYEFDIEYLRGKENRVADFLSRINTNKQEINLNDISENVNRENDTDMATIHSGVEDLHDHIPIVDHIVNTYLTQIHIVPQRERETERLYGKYKLIYISENELNDNNYLNDLLRRVIKKGKIAKYDRHPQKTKLQISETPDEPNDIVCGDVFYCYKLTFLTTFDKFSKHLMVQHLPDRNALTIIDLFRTRFAILGKPNKLVLDNEFNSLNMRDFCREENIEVHFTSPRSHTGNSDIERVHGTLNEHLRIFETTKCKLNTIQRVFLAVEKYNNSIHSTIEVRPLDILNGKVSNLELNINRSEFKPEDSGKILVKNPETERYKTAPRYIQIESRREHNKLIDNNNRNIHPSRIKRKFKFISGQN